MRLLWHSNAPWNGSGYGVQTAMFVPRIASLGHEVVISAPYSFGGNVLEWEGFQVLPCVRDPAGTDVISAHYEFFKADAMITLADVFGLLKCADILSQLNVAHWFPCDARPAGEGDITVLREGRGVPIAMSRFGQRVLEEEGALDCLYVPHGVDTDMFSPGDPAIYRDSIPEIGPDTFVIGMCAMNRDPQRKGFAEQLLAFSRFHARHPDSVMSLHTVPVAPTPATNIHGLAARLGISGAVVFPEPYLYDTGMITRPMMSTWYNGLDVLSFCSYAEGFGLPLIEAQACGVPVITTDGSSMSELCGAGWLVSGTPWWTTGHGAWWKRPDADDIEAAYEIAWQAKQDGTLPKKPARDFALLYDADRVFDVFWVPVLKELEQRFAS